MKLAFQGELGAFSHLAATEFFPKSEIKTCQTFEECFKLAKENLEYKIIIPIENSLAGRVADIHYLIPKYKLQIYAEYFHPVIHNLLGLKGSKIVLKSSKKNVRKKIVILQFFPPRGVGGT